MDDLHTASMLFDKRRITHIRGLDHPESLGVDPDGNVFTTGTGCQVYHIDIATETVRLLGSTSGRVLGTAVDSARRLYLAQTTGNVLRMTPDGEMSTYAIAPQGRSFGCPNYLAFDRDGSLYLSDSGTWSGRPDGAIYKIAPGGKHVVAWLPAIETPNAIAIDATESWLYVAGTFTGDVVRVEIRPDGTSGRIEHLVRMHHHVPDGLAIDREGRLWIACHRPDAIYILDPESRRLELFCYDWAGHELRGPTDVAFAGPQRDIVLAASLDGLMVHRFDNTGFVGLPLNFPNIP